LELAREEELNEIRHYYALSCPICGDENISISVKDKVTVECDSCSKIWNGPKELTEETGPRLAELLKIKRNKGIWEARWDMLSSRTGTVFSALTAARKTKLKTKKKQTIKAVQAKEKPECPKCGSPMKLVTPRPGQRWKKFWGCTKYSSRGCRGSRRA
jgi:ssDNA-binding Zn-finger/Zn-ribbon topoisomerase 1